MGIEKPEKTSRCIRAAIMRGHIKLKGLKEDLDMVVWKGEGTLAFLIRHQWIVYNLGDLEKV